MWNGSNPTLTARLESASYSQNPLSSGTIGQAIYNQVWHSACTVATGATAKPVIPKNFTRGNLMSARRAGSVAPARYLRREHFPGARAAEAPGNGNGRKPRLSPAHGSWPGPGTVLLSPRRPYLINPRRRSASALRMRSKSSNPPGKSAKIAPATLRKYRTFTKQLTAFAEQRGYVMLDQFRSADIDVFYS